MELRRLKYFVTAAHELSFSGAARKLGISQPVLSRGIKELEEYVGGELFHRSTTDISLTAIGESFLPNADEALLTLDQAILSVRQAAKGRDCVLNVAYLPALFEPVVGPAMTVFRQAFENVILRVHEQHVQGQLDELKAGKIDIAFICYYDGDDFGSDFDLFDITEAPNCALVSATSPFAAAKTLSLAEIAHLDFITFKPSQFPHCHNAIKRYFEAHSVAYKPCLHANSIHSMISSVVAADSFAIMTSLGQTIAPRSVSFVPLPEFAPMHAHFGALVKRDEKRKTVLAFLQECRRVAETRMPRILSEYAAERSVSVPPTEF